jgi:hypothetical protein
MKENFKITREMNLTMNFTYTGRAEGGERRGARGGGGRGGRDGGRRRESHLAGGRGGEPCHAGKQQDASNLHCE